MTTASPVREEGRTPQPFEAFPGLAVVIENIGWKASGISLRTWGKLLAEINGAIVSLEARAIAAESALEQMRGNVRTEGAVDGCPKCKLLDVFKDMPLSRYANEECGRPGCPLRSLHDSAQEPAK